MGANAIHRVTVLMTQSLMGLESESDDFIHEEQNIKRTAS